jgi:hypothetical protein
MLHINNVCDNTADHRKSFALDVHVLARFGRRVVLIGEGSLEANVGFTTPLRIIQQRFACGNAALQSPVSRLSRMT